MFLFSLSRGTAIAQQCTQRYRQLHTTHHHRVSLSSSHAKPPRQFKQRLRFPCWFRPKYSSPMENGCHRCNLKQTTGWNHQYTASAAAITGSNEHQQQWPLPGERTSESSLRGLEPLAVLRAEHGVEVLYQGPWVAVALLEAVDRGGLVQHLRCFVSARHGVCTFCDSSSFRDRSFLRTAQRVICLASMHAFLHS